MLAQRCNAKIDAIEIDNQAYLEAKYNFEQSSWEERLTVYRSDFSTFSNEQGKYMIL